MRTRIQKNGAAPEALFTASGLHCKHGALSILSSFFFYVASNFKPEKIPKLYHALKRRSREKRIYLGGCSLSLSGSNITLQITSVRITYVLKTTSQSEFVGLNTEQLV